MASGYVLAIDQGTTGTKVIVFDHDAKVRGTAYAELTQYYPRPGWVEHDPEEIWRGVAGLMKEALNSADVGPTEIVAIGITNQRESAVLWDRRTGQPIAPAIVWQDRRTAEMCDELKSSGHEELVRARTGLVIDAYFSATKIKWLLDNVKELRRRAIDGEIAFGTVDSWLIWNLTGGKEHITDVSNASRTMLYNIREMEWDADLLALFEVPHEILPEVRPSSAMLCRTSPEAFFGFEVPICGVAGDQQAALFGQGCFLPGQAKNTYGTGSFLLLNTGSEAIASNEGMLTTVGWQLGNGPVQYALEGAVFITGAAVQWLRDGLGIISSASETAALAESLPSNEGVYFVPALSGLGGPHWDPYARGTIVGITRGTGRAHFVRAALEGICYQCADVISAMERDSGIQLADIRADGGAVGNDFLMQFQADIVGVPVIVPSITETTSLGAAYLAGLAVGFWRNTEELSAHWREARRFEPRIDANERQRLHSQWLRAVERSRNWA